MIALCHINNNVDKKNFAFICSRNIQYFIYYVVALYQINNNVDKKTCVNMQQEYSIFNLLCDCITTKLITMLMKLYIEVK